MKILAVDDEPLFLEVLDVALQDLGFVDVTPIYSAKEALRELEAGKKVFDCILLDIRMPGMSGVELCRKIRAVPGYKRTPIMMITAMTDREFIDDAFAAGASDYLTKPLDTLELKARMSMVERLIVEQSRNVLLEQRSNLPYAPDDEDAIALDEVDFDFDTPVTLLGFDRVIDYPALENYMKSLSAKDSYTASVLAVAISNAERLFEKASRVDFLNMLYDVGVTVETVLKPAKALTTYAGSGVFVAALAEGREPDVHLIEDQIKNRLKDFEQIYERDGLPAPMIAVGPAVRKSLFLRPDGPNMLRHAISAAKAGAVALPEDPRRAAGQ